jgi:hypothetical protein
MPLVTIGGEPCASVAPSCPAPRPNDAQTLIAIQSCAFRRAEGSCEPVPIVPGCPRSSWTLFMTMVNPNRSDAQPCFSGGDLHLFVNATPDGGASVRWEALERDPMTCQFTDLHIQGTASVTGACCERVVDVLFPAGEWIARFVIRTDWQQQR